MSNTNRKVFQLSSLKWTSEGHRGKVADLQYRKRCKIMMLFTTDAPTGSYIQGGPAKVKPT